MAHSTIRYTTIGMASMTGLILLALTLLSDPKVLLNRLPSFQAASEPSITENVMLTDEREVFRLEIEALQLELTALRQQVADLTKQNVQSGPREEQPRALATVDMAVANPAVTKTINPPPMTMRLTGSLQKRLERVETCLVEAQSQEAALLLESILFQLTFRPAPGQAVQETAAVIKQALAAVAEADLEKAAFYVSEAQPKFQSSL